MDYQTAFSKLKSIFKSVNEKQIDVDNIKPSDRLIEDLGLNSIGIVYMAFVLERECSIDMSNVSFKSFKTVDDVIKYITK